MVGNSSPESFGFDTLYVAGPDRGMIASTARTRINCSHTGRVNHDGVRSQFMQQHIASQCNNGQTVTMVTSAQAATTDSAAGCRQQGATKLKVRGSMSGHCTRVSQSSVTRRDYEAGLGRHILRTGAMQHDFVRHTGTDARAMIPRHLQIDQKDHQNLAHA